MKIVTEDKEEFLKIYMELIERGIKREKIKVFTPFPVKEIHNKDLSRVKYFSLSGSILGLLFGFFLTIYTSLEWNEILGGKPPLSIPPFIIIAYELTILFGGVLSFIGFLILRGKPEKKEINPEERNKFVIIVEEV